MRSVYDFPIAIDTDPAERSPLLVIADEITRRIRENDPVELRTEPGTGITMRVVGFTRNGTPVFHPADRQRLAEWREQNEQPHPELVGVLP